jgi:hypothetical protein
VVRPQAREHTNGEAFAKLSGKAYLEPVGFGMMKEKKKK